MTRTLLFQSLLGAGLLLVTLLSVPQAAAQRSGDVVDEIAAVVDNEIILRSDVNALLANYLQQNERSYSQAMWMEALDELINQQVLAVHAQRDTTIEVSDDQVNQAIDRRIDQLAAQVGGRSRVEELYGKTLVQIRADLRDDFRSQMLAEQFQGRRMQRIDVTPTEVRDFFARVPQDSLPRMPDMVEASHIVVYPKASQSQKEETREMITAIRDSIVHGGGASFEDMARQFSEDPGSASNGGRLQDINLNDLFPEFAAVATRVEPGTVSQVFETPLGFHILRLNQRRGDIVDFNHILLRLDASKADPSEALAKLSAVRDSIVTGKQPFALMARRHSEESLTSERGGRVIDPRTGDRQLPLEQLGPSWSQTLRDLEEGEISEPTEVELLDGQRAYHIVRLDEFIPAHRVSLETDYQRIQQLAKQQKQARVMQQWMDQIRQDVYVDVRIDPADVAMSPF